MQTQYFFWAHSADGLKCKELMWMSSDIATIFSCLPTAKKKNEQNIWSQNQWKLFKNQKHIPLILRPNA